MTFPYHFQKKYLNSKRHEYYFGNLSLPITFLSLLEYFFNDLLKDELQSVSLGFCRQASGLGLSNPI